MSEKCREDDPRRCRGITSNGQCNYLAVEGSQFCDFHTKGSGERQLQKRKFERYLIDRTGLRDSYKRQQDDSEYLSLKEEIMLLHAMLEMRLNAIKSDADVLMAVGPIEKLIGRLESMKISLLRIQQQLGLVLGKDQLRGLAISIADILTEELDGVEDKEGRIDSICERLFEAIEQAGVRKEED